MVEWSIAAVFQTADVSPWVRIPLPAPFKGKYYGLAKSGHRTNCHWCTALGSQFLHPYGWEDQTDSQRSGGYRSGTLCTVAIFRVFPTYPRWTITTSIVG